MSNTHPCYKLSRMIVDNHIPLDNLRLETSPTRFCVVPYHHLEFAEFESAQSEEVLTAPCGSGQKPAYLGRSLAGTDSGIHQPPARTVSAAGQW